MAKKSRITFKDGRNRVFVDADKIISLHNSKLKPGQPLLNRTQLAKMLGVKTQTFVNWKNSGAPKSVVVFLALLDLVDGSPADIVQRKK